MIDALKENAEFANRLDDLVDDFIGRREVPLMGQLQALDPARKLTEHDLLSPRRHLIYRVTQGPTAEQIVLRGHGIALVLPAALENAVRYLSSGRASARDLPVTLSVQGKLTLATRLLREGLIERV